MSVPAVASGKSVSWSWELLALSGALLVAGGIAALVIAATRGLLPQDLVFLQMSREQLCALQGCRVLHFMVHDRVAFGGSVIATGLVYLWLAARPLAQGEAWAWWALAISGTAGFLSFLAYLGFGYLDLWHGRATVLLLPVFVAGLLRSRHGLRGETGIGSLLPPAMRPPLRGRAGLGRGAMLFAAMGMILGGATIMFLGSTRVFVPQDLEFMRIGVDELKAISPRLLPVIAHDRAGFGGGLCSGGLAILFAVWCGVRPGERALWWVLASAGTVGFGCAIGIHPVVGYLSLSHLLPALVGAASFVTGMALLHGPICQPRTSIEG